MNRSNFTLSQSRLQRGRPRARLPYLPLLLGGGAVVILAIAAWWAMVGFAA